jgi:tetratricopeptide (TPR) repeat protein
MARTWSIRFTGFTRSIGGSKWMGSSRTKPNTALQQRIAEAGLSYDALARTICAIARENGDHRQRANKASVAHWVAGACPHPRTVEYLAEALSRKLGRLLTAADIGLPSEADRIFDQDTMPADPVAAIAHLGRADVDRRTLITTAGYSIGALVLPLGWLENRTTRSIRARGRSVTVGIDDVHAVRELTAAFNAADERLGGAHARSAVVEYLASDVATYLDSRFASDDVRKAMFGAAAELAYLAGWKAHDAGLAGLAQQYYLRCFQLATESDPRAHAGYALRILAHQAMDLGRHEHCVDLADEALARTRGRVDANVESLFWLTVARANAANKAPREARAALNKAERLIDRGRAEQGPSWAALGGPAEARLAHQAGKTLQALGDLRAAEEQHNRAARCWNPQTHRRVHGLTLADLAETQCQQGHVEQACATWNDALDSMHGIRSARTRKALSSLQVHLAIYRNRGVPAARRLDARAARMLGASEA